MTDLYLLLICTVFWFLIWDPKSLPLLFSIPFQSHWTSSTSSFWFMLNSRATYKSTGLDGPLQSNGKQLLWRIRKVGSNLRQVFHIWLESLWEVSWTFLRTSKKVHLSFDEGKTFDWLLLIMAFMKLPLSYWLCSLWIEWCHFNCPWKLLFGCANLE